MTRFIPDASQAPARARLRWGPVGAVDAVRQGEIVVVVDALSFSTSAALGCWRGARVIPVADRSLAPEAALRHDAEVAVARHEVPGRGRFSLSPATLATASPGDRIVLPSPNGSALCRAVAAAPLVMVGAFVNAGAVARVAARLARATDLPVTVLAAGERAPDHRGHDALRVALEDQLAAGAILAGLGLQCSPEAEAAVAGWRASEGRHEAMIADSESGRELVRKGYPEDLRDASRLDVCPAVPLLQGESLSDCPPALAAVDPGLAVRSERDGDQGSIAAVHDAAFGRSAESGLVGRLRMTQGFDAAWSRLAVLHGRVVGHALGSPAEILGPGGRTPCVAIGPVAVVPGLQRGGIGRLLLASLMAIGSRAGNPVAVLLGDPGYYLRSGFVPSRELGIEPPPGYPPRAFLARRLAPPPIELPRGTVRYPEAFGLVDPPVDSAGSPSR